MERRPIIIDNGELKELPIGDTLPFETDSAVTQEELDASKSLAIAMAIVLG